MKHKELLEAVARLVKRQVSKEVDKRMRVMRAEVISEVAGMLNYSERKLLSQLGETRNAQARSRRVQQREVDDVADNDFDRVMNNLRSMPAFDRITEKVSAKPKSDTKYTEDTLLNSILNETDAFSKDEVANISGGNISEFLDFGGQSNEPWNSIDEPLDLNEVTSVAPTPIKSSAPILGTDHKAVDVTNPTVQKVMDILANTNHKAKLDAITEAGNQFRGASPVAPRFASTHFEKMVD